MKIQYKIQEPISAREYIASYYVSRSKIYSLFQEKRVFRGEEILKENTMLAAGDVLSIEMNEQVDYAPEYGEIDILYEDEYYLILNKPSGMIIHEDDKSKKGTLSNLVAGYYKEKGYDLNVRFAHRLDTETTGVIVFCKDILCHAYMNHFISTHEIRREYRALVQGTMEKKTDRLELPMGSDRHEKKKMRVSKTGVDAITNYEVLYTYKGYSLLRILLETGRTHQIRVHMSYIGHPLLGDSLYGGSMAKMHRVALHSYMIRFVHPVNHMDMNVTAAIPQDMKKLMG